MKTQINHFWIAAWLSFTYLCLYGYAVGINDHSEYLPSLYFLKDHELYPSDLFIKHFREGFTVRFYWLWAVHLLSMAVPLYLLLYLLTALSLLGCLYYWLKIWSLLYDLHPRHLVILGVIWLFTHKWVLGENYYLSNMFGSSSVTDVLVPAAFYYILKRNQHWSFTCLGIAALFQPLAAIQAYIIVIIWELTLQKNISILKSSFIFWMISLAMWVPLMYNQVLNPCPANSILSQAMFQIRGFRHFVPHLFPYFDWILFTALLLASVIVIAQNTKQYFAPAVMVLIIVVGCAGYCILYYVFGITEVLSSQWFKTTSIANGLMVGMIYCRFTPSWCTQVPMIKFDSLKRKIIWVPLVGICILPCASLMSIPKAKRYSIWSSNPEELSQIHAWIANHTPKEALFLYPPSNTGFPSEAMRSSPLSCYATVHNSCFIKDWLESIKTYLHADFHDQKNKNLFLYLDEKFYHYTLNIPLSPGLYVLYDQTKGEYRHPHEVVYTLQKWVLIQTL